MNRGGWAFPIAPRQDELLSSWLSRSAFAHGQGTHVFCNYYLPGHAVWTRDVDRRPAADTLSRLSEVSGIPFQKLRGCTLGAMAGFSRLGPGLGRWPWLLSAGVFHRKRRLHGLQFCPACLGAGPPYFRREWRLAFMSVCPVHGVPLLDACRACGEPLCPHRSLRYRVEYCHACERDLRDYPAAGTFATDASDLQRALLRAVFGGPVRWRGCDFPYADFLGTCRVLMGKLSGSATASCRSVFGLRGAGLPPDPASGREFEDMRLGERRLRIETLQAWMDEWPESVLYGARAMGLTQQSFAHTVLPGALARVLARLRPGQGRRRRPAMTKLVQNASRRMKRHSPTRYRRARARYLLASAGIGR